MKLPRYSISLLVFLVAIAHVFAERDKPKTPLGEQMSQMAKSFRELRRVINDPAQKEAAIKLVKDMEQDAEKAKTFEPEHMKEIAPDKRDEFVAGYKKKIDELLGNFDKLEGAIRDGKTDEVKAVLDEIQIDKRKGHEEFNPQKD